MGTGTVLIVRPETSRAIGAFWRNLGHTMVSSYAISRGLPVRMADLTFDSLDDTLSADVRVAVFSLYIDDFSRGMEVAEHIKKQRPDVVTFVGGPHVTMVGDDVPGIYDAFDYVAVGDCLPEAMDIVETACVGGTLPTRGAVRAERFDARMDHLAPNYDIWSENRYFPLYPVEFSRGCRQRCPFCTDPVLRRGLAVDPVEKTFGVLERLARDGSAHVRFVDSSLTSLGTDLEVLLNRMIAAQLQVTWSAYAYPHDVTRVLADRLAAAGCRAVFMGIETMSSTVRTGKHHTKRPDEIARSVQALQNAGIFVHGNFIIGLPGETADTVETTLTALEEVRFDSVGGGPFYLAAGSTFTQRPERFGIEVFDPHWTRRAHENFYEPVPYFRTATMTQADMIDLTGYFRDRVIDSGLACWNLSDFVALCWLSVGGELDTLSRLWNAPTSSLTERQGAVLNILRDRNNNEPLPPGRARTFVAEARSVASAS